MSIMETLKTAGKVVVEAAKANPVAAGCIAVGAAAAIGGGVWYNKKRKAKKAAEAAAPAAAGSVAEAVAETAKPVLAVVDGQQAKTA